MDIREAVVAEIARLNKVLDLLDSSVSTGNRVPSRVKRRGTGKRKKMSAAARAKISAAQKLRWSKVKKTT